MKGNRLRIEDERFISQVRYFIALMSYIDSCGV